MTLHKVTSALCHKSPLQNTYTVAYGKALEFNAGCTKTCYNEIGLFAQIMLLIQGSIVSVIGTWVYLIL